MPARELTDVEADRLSGALADHTARVRAMREVADALAGIVIEAIKAGCEDGDEGNNVLHMVITRLQEERDS